MNELLSAHVSEGFMTLCGMGLGLVAILCTTAVVGAGVTSYNRRKSLADEMEATLKIEMIERGMTPDDIERVLHAKMGTPEEKTLSGLVGGLAMGHGCRTREQHARPT